jgi:hypothetical protein
MIISHKYKYIFVKTSKTAGTSLEIALSKYCGEEDIITPIARTDEVVRQELGYRGPQNYWAPFTDYRLADWRNYFLRKRRKKRYFNHIQSAEIKTQIGDDIWNTYYKFCFERNPWERFISFYYWKNRRIPDGQAWPTVYEFLDSGACKNLKRHGWDAYPLNGEIAVDRVCLLENRQAELNFLEERLGLPGALEMPRTKSTYRKDKRRAAEILTPEEKDLIYQKFSQEINAFGYSIG